jgi:hypothetical protein
LQTATVEAGKPPKASTQSRDATSCGPYHKTVREAGRVEPQRHVPRGRSPSGKRFRRNAGRGAPGPRTLARVRVRECPASTPYSMWRRVSSLFPAARTRTQQQPPLRSLVGLRHGRRPPSRLPRRAVPSRSGPRSPAASRSAPCSSTRESAHVRHRGDLEYAPSREIPVSEWECPARRGCPRRRTTHQDSVLELARER